MSSIGKNFLFSAATICFCLGLLFGLDRLFGYFFPAHPVYLNKAHFSMETYATNYRGYFKSVRTGADGTKYFFIDRDHEIDREHPHAPLPKNAAIVAAVGDSFTYGQGVRLEDTYVKRIEKGPFRRPIFGMNLGRLGANVKAALDQLNAIDKTRAPSLVIYGYVLNDTIAAPTANVPFQYLDAARASTTNDVPLLWDFMNVRTMNIESRRPPFWQRLAKFSRAVDFALSVREKRSISRNTIQHYKDLHDPAKNSLGLKLTVSTVREMKASAEKLGSKFLVVIFPIFYKTGKSYPFMQAHAVLRDSFARNEVDVIDLAPAYAAYTDEDLWVHPVDQHPNDLGHKIAADQIVNWIKERKLLD